MEYDIRMANKKDLDGLCAIRNNKELFCKYLNQHEKKEIYLAIAEWNSIIVGFGVLKLKGSLLPKLSDLYVSGTARGKGIGSDLIGYREEIARAIGYSGIFVSVDPIGNPKMIQLITKLGYEAISEPYSKTAIFYNDDGTIYEKTYPRIDFKKLLN